jgi:anti-sigma regulatory factor (Ser/Thr protein kinase)
MLATDHVLRFPGTSTGLDAAVRSLRGLLSARDLDPGHAHDVELVFEEIASNIVNYGRPRGDIEVVIRFDGGTVLTFEDDGMPFDPRTQPPPPAATRPQDLRIGGLGLVIVRRLCSQLDYVRTAEARNRLTLEIPAVTPAR